MKLTSFPLLLVQVEGCKVLCTMALNHMQNKDAIVKGMEIIVKAMAAHPTSCDMQSEGCAALATLSFRNSFNKQRISEAGGKWNTENCTCYYYYDYCY